MSKKPCSVEGCERSAKARGWCPPHYMRWKRHGDPLGMVDSPLYKRDRTCSIDGCEEPHRARGWCTTHHQAWVKHGDPAYQRDHPIYRDPQAAFAARTEVDGDCLVWTGHRSREGYGYIKVAGKSPRGAHRVAWELENGPVAAGLVVRHKCDNPPCVKLDHLELGTHQDNVNDMIARGRAHWQKTPEEAP